MCILYFQSLENSQADSKVKSELTDAIAGVAQPQTLYEVLSTPCTTGLGKVVATVSIASSKSVCSPMAVSSVGSVTSTSMSSKTFPEVKTEIKQEVKTEPMEIKSEYGGGKQVRIL